MDIRQVSEVDESKKSYTLDLHFYMRWRDERLVGLTGRTNCSPLFPDHTTAPEFWIPGEVHLDAWHMPRARKKTVYLEKLR